MSGLNQAEHTKTSATTRQSTSSRRSRIEDHPDRRDMIYAEKDSIISDVISNPKSLEKVLHAITEAPSEQDVVDCLMKVASAFDTYYSQAKFLTIDNDYNTLPESLDLLARHMRSCIHDKDSGSEVNKIVGLDLPLVAPDPPESKEIKGAQPLLHTFLELVGESVVPSQCDNSSPAKSYARKEATIPGTKF
jgi:hypothetical protein